MKESSYDQTTPFLEMEKHVNTIIDNGNAEIDCSCLFDQLQQQYPKIVSFFHMLGLVWIPLNDKKCGIYVTLVNNSWFVLLRFTIIVSIVWPIFDSMKVSISLEILEFWDDFIIDIMTVLQLWVLGYSINHIRKELRTQTTTNQTQLQSFFFQQTFHTALYYFISMTVISTIVDVLWSIQLVRNYPLVESALVIDVIGHALYSVTATGFLTATLHFVIADTTLCNHHIEKLILLASNDTLTIAEFNKSKKVIREQINKTKFINTIRIVVAVLFVLVLLLTVLTVSRNHMVQLVLYSLSAGMKELLFVTVIFFHAAKVNESADKLTKLLGDGKSVIFCSIYVIRYVSVGVLPGVRAYSRAV